MAATQGHSNRQSRMDAEDVDVLHATEVTERSSARHSCRFGASCPQDACMLWKWLGVGPSMMPAGAGTTSLVTGGGDRFVGMLAGPLRENLVMDQSRTQPTAAALPGRGPAPARCLADGTGNVERGQAQGWRLRRLDSGASGACRIDRPAGYECISAACLAPEGPVPAASLRPTDGSPALAPGSKRGANDGRCRAAPGDVRRMKLLVRRHVATVGYRLGSYGMQEVRGSNPRSSTRFPRSKPDSKII